MTAPRSTGSIRPSERAPADHRRSRRYRRRSWFGAKRHVKAVLAMAPVAAAMEPVLRRTQRPDSLRRWPVPGDEVTGTVGGASFVMTDPWRCTVAKELYWGDGHRPNPEERFALDLAVALAGDASVFLDIGAYTGVFSLAVAARHRDVSVHAFELVPDIYGLLFANVARNDMLGRITCHCLALGRPGGPGDAVHIPVGLRGSSLPTSFSSGLHFDDGVGVPRRSLDQVADTRLGDHVGRCVVKVDIEGGEVDLLTHAPGFLERSRPDIICEVLAGQPNPGALEVALAPHGYRYHLVGDGRLHPRPSIEPDPHLRDWLFTTRPEAEVDILVASISSPGTSTSPPPGLDTR